MIVESFTYWELSSPRTVNRRGKGPGCIKSLRIVNEKITSMGFLQTVIYKSISPSITQASQGETGLFLQHCRPRNPARDFPMVRISLPQVHLHSAAFISLNPMYSSQWFAALCVVLLLVAAVGVLCAARSPRWSEVLGGGWLRRSAL